MFFEDGPRDRANAIFVLYEKNCFCSVARPSLIGDARSFVGKDSVDEREIDLESRS